MTTQYLPSAHHDVYGSEMAALMVKRPRLPRGDRLSTPSGFSTPSSRSSARASSQPMGRGTLGHRPLSSRIATSMASSVASSDYRSSSVATPRSYHPGQLAATPRPNATGPPIGMHPGEDFQDLIYRTGESHYAATHGTEPDLQREVKKALRSRQRTREEHEHRWRQWQHRQKRKQSAGSVVTEATSVSVMPAGMRRAKGMSHEYDGPMRVALFDEDLPRPIWTTLASAPWATGMVC